MTVGPRRLYIAVAIFLLVILSALFVALATLDRRTGSPTTTDTEKEGAPAHMPVWQGAISELGTGSFRPRGGVMVDGIAYFADSEGARLLVLGPTDQSFRSLPIAPDIAIGELENRPQPTDVALAPDGTLLVPDRANAVVWRVARDGSFLGAFGHVRKGGPPLFNQPVGIGVSGDEVYVTDVGTQEVRVFSTDGRALRSFGEEGYLPGQLSYPNDVASDGRGQVYVADSNNRRVQVFSPQGQFLGEIKGSAETGEVVLPRSLAIDEFGRLHVVDTFSQVVYIFGGDGAPLGSYGSESDSEKDLNLPEGIALASGSIVVADGGNQRLVRYRY
jgi:DNA-binding beta-propeller fold protein YncE